MLTPSQASSLGGAEVHASTVYVLVCPEAVARQFLISDRERPVAASEFARATAQIGPKPTSMELWTGWYRSFNQLPIGGTMFENFQLEMIRVPETTLRVRHGGSGPPLLLLHGHPRTHTTWYKVAPALARQFTVVCPDLRGFGKSGKPSDPHDYEASSKRAKARDCVALMEHLGFDEFFLAGHDRGSYTAFRTAMDHPARVKKLAILDGVPILEALERCDARFASHWWHWFFFAQRDKPEQAILANPSEWYGGAEASMGSENFVDFFSAIQDAATVRGMLGDYRAGIHVDHLHDRDDRNAGRKLICPLHVIWSAKDDLEDLYGDVLAVWQPWAELAVTGAGIDCGHHMAEEAPVELTRELVRFFSG
ncbi:fluoroacetate dehalogenase [Sinorhizobium sp. KGO-5]|nr:fluoroacetate dehalogenase [Sinorhizobium sp. KGO-5]